MQIRHDNNVLIGIIDNVEVGYLEYLLIDNTIDVKRVFIKEEYRNKHLASILMEEIIRYANKYNYKLIGSCSYAKSYLDKRGSNESR